MEVTFSEGGRYKFACYRLTYEESKSPDRIAKIKADLASKGKDGYSIAITYDASPTPPTWDTFANSLLCLDGRLEPLRALLNMITSLINGLIVGSLHFILNLLDGLDDVDLLLDHTVDSVKNFFTAFLNLGTSLFPFIPAEWLTIIEAALVILAIGVIIKRRVF